MALGLATGIIGSAMNMTAAVLGDMLPGIVGIIVMIAFLIFGHSINFGLSTMGAFIHSMRLQFIEFFGVFYSGGAEMFKPFTRIKKYLLFRS
jgi:V/A-type H+-transporting ATPase subunit I